MTLRRYSEETLNAFVDGELGPEESDQLIADMSLNPALSQAVCRLNHTRELIRYAYRQPPEPRRTNVRRPSRYSRWIAAAILLSVGGVVGWSSNQLLVQTERGLPEMARVIELPATATEEVNLVLHINSWDPEKLASVLDETELLLASYQQSNQQLQVEVMTNGSGLNLLRADVTPFEQRIQQIQQRFDNISFLACQQAINRQQKEQGLDVRLIPASRIVPSAVEQITRRQHQGWIYQQI